MLDSIISSGAKKTGGAGWRRDLLGHVLAGVLVVIAAFVAVIWIYQLDFWQHYFFHDSQSLGNDCTVSLAVTDDEARPSQFSQVKKIVVPHFGQPLFQEAIPKGKTAHAVYDCQIANVFRSETKGAVNIHVGWVVGDHVSIALNGTERVAHAGVDKTVVPMNADDLARDTIHLTVWAFTKNAAALGLIGKAPLVIADGTRKNNKIFGLETALQQGRSLYGLLPVLTLALILVFGWTFGIRSRLMVATLFYLVLIAGRYLLHFVVDLAPWDPIRTYPLQMAADVGIYLAHAVFGMELLGLRKRWIPKCMAATTVLVLVELTFFLVVTDVIGISVKVEMINQIILTVVTGLIVYAGLPRLRDANEDPSRRKINTVFLVTTAVYVLMSLVDYGLARFGVPVRISPKMNVIMPLFVGGVLLLTLALIEKNLRSEREQRAKMEGDLAIAAKLQGIITPSELEGRSHVWSYSIESKAFGLLGGDWVKVHGGETRSLFVLGDVVGKGPSAALTHSGIAAIWDTQVRLWDKGLVTSSDVLSAINSTMFGLFKGAMNTTFAAAEVSNVGEATVASCGNVWLHLGPQKCRLIPPTSRALLGLSDDLSVTFAKVEMAPGDWLVCFTDGVLEGHRPIKRFFTEISGQTGSLTPETIRARLTDLGKETVHADDASFLILRFEQDECHAVDNTTLVVLDPSA